MVGDQKTRCVSITGEPGVGKTERALQTCKYVQERRRFDKIVTVSCRQVMESASSPPRPTFGARRPEHVKYLCRLVSNIYAMADAMTYRAPFLTCILARSVLRHAYEEKSSCLWFRLRFTIVTEGSGVE